MVRGWAILLHILQFRQYTHIGRAGWRDSNSIPCWAQLGKRVFRFGAQILVPEMDIFVKMYGDHLNGHVPGDPIAI